MSYKSYKKNKTEKTLKYFQERCNFILIFSSIDTSEKNLQSFKSTLKKNKIKLYSIKTSLLKKVLVTLPGFDKIESFLNGPLYIGVSSEEIQNFSFKPDKKENFYLLGLFYNQELHLKSFASTISGFTKESLFNGLISSLVIKQSLLNLFLKHQITKLC